jgi:hypothetical protein
MVLIDTITSVGAKLEIASEWVGCLGVWRFASINPITSDLSGHPERWAEMYVFVCCPHTLEGLSDAETWTNGTALDGAA